MMIDEKQPGESDEQAKPTESQTPQTTQPQAPPTTPETEPKPEAQPAPAEAPAEGAKPAEGAAEAKPEGTPPAEQPPPKRRRGFAAMDPERVRQIASKGGRAAHAAGTAHQFTSEEARIAGRKGGLAPHVRRGGVRRRPPAEGADRPAEAPSQERQGQPGQQGEGQ